jgi:hypothetical protein
MISRARDKPERQPKNGEIVTIHDDDILPFFPVAVKEIVQNTGYVARFFPFPPAAFASIIERCLSNNMNRGSILQYSSSMSRKEVLVDGLWYYAILHVNTMPRSSLDRDFCWQPEIDPGMKKRGGKKKKIVPQGHGPLDASYHAVDSTDIAVIAIFSRDTGSIILTSARDISIYNDWIDKINDGIVHAMKRSGR